MSLSRCLWLGRSIVDRKKVVCWDVGAWFGGAFEERGEDEG